MGDREILREFLLNDHGDQVVLRLAEEPHPATRRLMRTLGVRVEVRPVTIVDERRGPPR